MIRKSGHEDSENVFKKLFAMSVDKTAMLNNLTLDIKKSVHGGTAVVESEGCGGTVYGTHLVGN